LDAGTPAEVSGVLQSKPRASTEHELPVGPFASP
jgi:hypothetical protein